MCRLWSARNVVIDRLVLGSHKTSPPVCRKRFVTAYRVFFLRGSLLDLVESLEAESDISAVEAASRFQGNAALEVWRGHRRLASFRSAPQFDPFNQRGRS